MDKNELMRQAGATTRQLREIIVRIALVEWAANRHQVDRRCAALYDVVQDRDLPLAVRSDAAEELIERLK